MIACGINRAVKNTVVSGELNVRCNVGRSLINIKKRMGPNTVPRGSPETTGEHEEAEPLTTTRWLRPLRKLRCQMLALLRIP